MSYINKTLLPDEKIIYRSHPHWIVVFRSWTVLMLVTILLLIGSRPNLLAIIFFAVLLFVVCLSGLIVYYTSEFGITNKRIVMKSGFISRVAFEHSLDRIEGVEINQSIIGRILDYGTIRIRGVSGTNELFSAVGYPFRFRYKVLDEIERQKKTK
ncbi:MAG: hypothetical protein RLY40_1253 [Pseudomonadota bacterium]|jgi:uncharacterized membrane protein YdbT with pleckstrin-like domain